MKKILLLVFLSSFLSYNVSAQLVLKKGTVMDDLIINDSITESFALYLPTSFETEKKWPVVFVFDMNGKGKQALSMFVSAAEEQGYILAASNSVNDSVSLSNNILISNRMFRAVSAILPIHNNRVYIAGFSSGGRFASIVPGFIKNITGVISCGATIPNIELLSIKRPFYFIGIVGNQDFNYPEMLELKNILNGLKFPNRLLTFEGGQEWPASKYFNEALRTFTLSSMAKGDVSKDSVFINSTYRDNLNSVNELVSNSKPLDANHLLGEMLQMYRVHRNIDSLKASKRTLKRGKIFKAQNRNRNAVFFKEKLIKDDYIYYLEEDILSYNYNNLGWWNYQMGELVKYNNSRNIFERNMGKRLRGFLNALIADNIDMIKAEKTLDREALNFLWMLKTITAPKEYENYLNVISRSAEIEDYGTALFYLEELLKNGYQDREELYALEHTALFRITPEFNEIVAKYLKDSRYEIND